MAHMIPPEPKEFTPSSDEGTLFEALKKLSDEYYVFHSVSTCNISDNIEYNREMDFVIAHQKKGVLVIEAKNGSRIQVVQGVWYYGNGEQMKRGGPYNQASTAMYNLKHLLNDSKDSAVRDVVSVCKFHSAVWFPAMTELDLKGIHFPTEADREKTLTYEDLTDPTKAIEKIMSIRYPSQREGDEDIQMTGAQFKYLLNNAICPTFNLVSTPSTQRGIMDLQFNQLLREQYRILDFLDEQQSAVINGAAGTGKTMLAVEKARRHSVNGDRVLFLCYNRLLRDNLEATHKKNGDKEYSKQFENVDFFTINALTRQVTGRYDDYDGLQEWLANCSDKKDTFPYQHVIVDEGQDFGMIDAGVANSDNGSGDENSSIINWLQEAAIANNGTFYLFYDKHQMVQGGGSVKYTLPDCIQNSDCRLTLHCNCRNTQQIAETSVAPLRDSSNKTIKSITASFWGESIKPCFHIAPQKSDVPRVLDDILTELEAKQMKDVVILTTGIEDYSAIHDKLIPPSSEFPYSQYPHKRNSYRMTTCIKFKGLEADAIIVIDLSKDSFTEQKRMNFYVGTSRARFQLDMIAVLSDDDCNDVIHELDPGAPNRRNAPDRMHQLLGNLLYADVK